LCRALARSIEIFDFVMLLPLLGSELSPKGANELSASHIRTLHEAKLSVSERMVQCKPGAGEEIKNTPLKLNNPEKA